MPSGAAVPPPRRSNERGHVLDARCANDIHRGAATNGYASARVLTTGGTGCTLSARGPRAYPTRIPRVSHAYPTRVRGAPGMAGRRGRSPTAGWSACPEPLSRWRVAGGLPARARSAGHVGVGRTGCRRHEAAWLRTRGGEGCSVTAGLRAQQCPSGGAFAGGIREPLTGGRGL